MPPVTDGIKWERVTDKATFFSVVENMGRSRKVNEFVDWCLGDAGKFCNWWMNSALGMGHLAEFTSWAPSKPFVKGPFPEKAFADLVVKHGPKLCWDWRGDFDHEGRPVYKFQKAYRVSYALYRGPITGGEDIHHKRFNRQCVNPANLEKLTKDKHKAKHRGHSGTARTLSVDATDL